MWAWFGKKKTAQQDPAARSPGQDANCETPLVLYGIRYTHLLAVPCSGHGGLVSLLQQFYGTRLVYSGDEMSEVKLPLLSGRYINLVQTADPYLKLAQTPRSQYLVFNRPPLQPMITAFDQAVATEKLKDSRESWQRYSESALAHWERFTRKWVQAPASDSCQVIDGDALLLNPEALLPKVISFLSDELLGPAQMSSLLAQTPIEPLSPVTAFRYYEERTFQAFQERIQKFSPGLARMES